MKPTPNLISGFQKNISSFVRGLFTLDKHSLVFSFLYCGFLLLSSLVIRTWLPLSFLKNRLYLLDIYAFILIYMYKTLVGKAEADLQRLSFQAVVLFSIVDVLSTGFILPMASNPPLFLLGGLLGQFPFIIEMSLALFGYIYILFHGLEMQTALQLALISLIITASSQLYKFYTRTFFIHFPGSLLLNALLVMFLIIACQKVIQPHFGFRNLTPFFVIGGLLLFCLELASGFLIDCFSGYMYVGYDYVGLLLLNFQTFLQFSLWGVYFLHKQPNSVGE